MKRNSLLMLLCHKIFQFPRKFDGMGDEKFLSSPKFLRAM